LVNLLVPKLAAASASPADSLVIPRKGRPHVTEFEAAVIDYFVAAAEMLGAPKSLAAIYGILFASPEPLTFAEISDRLDLSAGSISTGLRTLRDIGAIKEVSAPTDRAELFQPDTEMRQIVTHFLESRVEAHLRGANERFASFDESLPHFAPSEQKILRQRIKKLKGWHVKAKALLPLARGFLKLGR
jgi:DNA-binding transcriptional regulator GbsR (MarR family)